MSTATSDRARPIVPAARPSPRGERTCSQRVLGPFYVTGIFWVRAINWVARSAEWHVRLHVNWWTFFFFFFLWKARRTVLANLEPVLGPAGWLGRQARVWRHFHLHAWTMVERFEQFWPKQPAQIEFAGDAWEHVRGSPAGAVLVTAHFGNWELGTSMPMLEGSRAMHVVREAEETESTQRYVEHLLRNRPRGTIVTHYAGDDLQLGARLLHALRDGDVITLAGDRARDGMPTTRVPLFGRTVEMPIGWAALARAAGVEVVPVFMYRLGRRRYRMVAHEPQRVANSGDRTRDLQTAVEAFAGALERAIRTAPHHWNRWEIVWVDG